MTLSLGVQAAAVYAVALVLSFASASTRRRTFLIAACIVVALLPLLGMAPTWTAESPAAVALFNSLEVLQEPSGAPGMGALEVTRPAGLSVAAIAGWIWAVGLAFASLRLAADLLAVRRLRAASHDAHHGVATSPHVEVPMVLGVLRPLIVLPTAARHWPPSRRRLAIAHERAHVRHHDNAWLLLARSMACVHWFNPLAWWTVSALRQACEHRADEAVLKGGASATDYAEALIAVARERSPALGLTMARPSSLARRVRSILGPRQRPRRMATALGVAAVVGLGVGVATAAPRAPAPAATSPGPTALAGALEAEADQLQRAWSPEGVALLVMDARTGHVLGEAHRGSLSQRQVAFGSVMKPFAVVAALEAGVSPDHRFDDGDMASILERSSNVGAQQIAQHAGQEAILDVLTRVGLTVPSDIALDRLTLGGFATTPRRVASAWAHLAGHGAISATIAADTREMLVRAVEGPRATGRQAAVPGVRVAGKTGTAPLVLADGRVDSDRYLSSFVGLAPADDPDFVVLVSVAGPQGDSPWGGTVAAPAFRRIVEALRD